MQSVNFTRVLFWSVILIVLSFALTGQILGLNSSSINSKTDETIKIDLQKTSSSEGKIRLAAAYYEKYQETSNKSYLDNGIEILEKVNGDEFSIKNYILGILYLEKQEGKIALKYLENYIQNEPLHSEALLAQGSALIQLGKNKEAIACLKTLAKVRPEIADTYQLMSKAYENLGDEKMADKVGYEAEELLGRDPDRIPGVSKE